MSGCVHCPWVDKYTFAKEVLQETSERAGPDFEQTNAETFLAENYGAPKNIDTEKLSKWIKATPESSITSDYFNIPIQPVDIRTFLKGRKSNSAPGPDGMTYAILKKLPVPPHDLLATILSQT